MANGTSKNVGLAKFWQDLEISEAFFDKSRSLVFAWFVFTFFESRNFLPKSLGLGFLTRISASLGFYHLPPLLACLVQFLKRVEDLFCEDKSDQI